MKAPILAILTEPNPVLDILAGSSSLTKNSSFLVLRPHEISPWTDFTYDNLTAAFGHLLSLISTVVSPEDIRRSDKEIKKERDVETIGSVWTRRVTSHDPLKDALPLASKMLNVAPLDVTLEQGTLVLKWGNRKQHRRKATMIARNNKKLDKLEELVDGQKLTPQRVADAKRNMDKNLDAISYIMPDWHAYQRRPDLGTNIVTLVGETKNSNSWHSNQDLESNNHAPAVWILPFNQITTYCVAGGTRYGFIYTSMELVALRVMHDTNDDRPKVECKSISWEAHGKQLTMNLALWSLIMMSMKEEHRKIKSREETLPLNVWWRDTTEKGIIYKHHLSGRELAQLPAGGKAMTKLKDGWEPCSDDDINSHESDVLHSEDCRESDPADQILPSIEQADPTDHTLPSTKQADL